MFEIYRSALAWSRTLINIKNIKINPFLLCQFIIWNVSHSVAAILDFQVANAFSPIQRACVCMQNLVLISS